MVGNIITGMAFLGIIVNFLLLVAVFSLNRGTDKELNYYFVINLMALNTFLAGVVIYGTYNL